jgi:RNA polymerase sigma-70 factor (sigma-E family)
VGTTVIVMGGDRELATDLTGVESLFRSEYPRLVGLARLLVDDPGQAEEVVQEAFVALHRNWHQLREPGAAPVWLRRAVVNGSRGSLRKRATARRHMRVVEPSLSVGPDEQAVLVGEHAAVAAALRVLPDRQRACLALRFYDDLTEAQIAEALGISAGSVKTHVHRGIASLAAALEDIR